MEFERGAERCSVTKKSPSYESRPRCGRRGSERGCVTLFRGTTAESGETAALLEPHKLVITRLHLAKIMIDGKVMPREIIIYCNAFLYFGFMGSKTTKPHQRLWHNSSIPATRVNQ